MRAAGGADGGDGGGAIGARQVDDGDGRAGDDLGEARALRLRPDVVPRHGAVRGRREEVLRHAPRRAGRRAHREPTELLRARAKRGGAGGLLAFDMALLEAGRHAPLIADECPAVVGGARPSAAVTSEGTLTPAVVGRRRLASSPWRPVTSPRRGPLPWRASGPRRSPAGGSWAEPLHATSIFVPAEISDPAPATSTMWSVDGG